MKVSIAGMWQAVYTLLTAASCPEASSNNHAQNSLYVEDSRIGVRGGDSAWRAGRLKGLCQTSFVIANRTSGRAYDACISIQNSSLKLDPDGRRACKAAGCKSHGESGA
eukprot:6198366-Pleurochrysis_carterae.AAC.1